MPRYLFPRIVSVLCAILGTIVLISGILIGLVTLIGDNGTTPSAFEAGILFREAINVWFITVVSTAFLFGASAALHLLIQFVTNTRRLNDILIDIARMLSYQNSVPQNTSPSFKEDSQPLN